MQLQANCAAVIPCFNEARTINPIVSAVARQVSRVIVVDDGSTDRTAELAASAGAIVIRGDRRRGKGAALKTGLGRASDDACEWALTMDGDGQHSPDDLPALFQYATSSGAPLVVGNRMGEAHKMPWLRRHVNRAMSTALSRLAKQSLPDSQCGLRLLRLDLWRSLQNESRHFEIESELLLSFARAGHAIRFVPIQVIYRSERSKICPLRDTVRWFLWLRRARRAV